MRLVAKFANTKRCKKSWKTTETLACGNSSKNMQCELSNDYDQHDRVYMVFKILCVLVVCTKVVSALDGLRCRSQSVGCHLEFMHIRP